MTEKQLIANLGKLRQIKPRENWVLLAKQRILDQKPVIVRQYDRERVSNSFSIGLNELLTGLRVIFSHKFAFASLVAAIVLVGSFGFAQNSLPGDTLFSLKRIVEKSQAVFVSEKEQPKQDLKLANKRLDELTKIAQNNSVKNLASAINEYQTSVSKVAETLAKEEDREIVREMINEIRKLEEKEQQVRSLGTVIGGNEELDMVCAQKMIETLETFIEDLENRSLTEKQEEILAEVREDCQQGNYSQALQKLLLITQ